MDQELPEISYEAFYRAPLGERIGIFNDITPTNRASLIKTHANRWLAANGARLTLEQSTAIEEFIEAVSPEWYQIRPDGEDVHPAAERMIKRIESVLYRDDLTGLASRYAAYIPET